MAKRKAITVAEVIAGEARSQEDLEMIASVIVNRAMLAGVPVDDIVYAPNQFDAYNKNLPAGTTQADIDRAQRALDKVLKEGVPPQYSDAIGYARDYAVDNMPPSWEQTGVVTPDKHVVFSDPAGGWIATTGGYVAPNPKNIAGFQVDTASPFGPDPDHPAVPGWLSGPVDPTPVAVDDFSLPDPSASPLGGGLKDVADVTKAPGAWTKAGSFNDKVDPRLSDAVTQAANMFGVENPGYTVEAFSGYRPGDRRQHGKHRAIDVRIKDPTGTILDNYQSPETFRTYEKLAQDFKSVIDQSYPELSDVARWGGYFGGPKGKYGALDTMHFDLGGLSGLGMAGGTWAKGLNEQQRKNFPGVESIGMSQMAENVPIPTPAPDQTFGAPVDVVERGPLPDVPADFASPSLASMLSPFSSAQAATPLGSETVSPFASEQMSPLASEQMSPISGYDTIVGRDITDTFSGPSALMGTAVQPETSPQLGVNSVIDRLSPIGESLTAAPVSTAEPMSAIPGSVTSSWDSLYQKPEVSETLSPLTSETLSPLSDYETLTGTDVTMPSMGLYGGLLGAPTGLQPPGASPLQPSGFVSPVPTAEPVADVISPTPAPAPSLPPARTVATPKVASVDDPLGQFPEAPQISNWDKLAHVAGPIAKNASLGNTIGGPIGALAGGLWGAFGPDVDLGPQFDSALPQTERFSTGYGLDAISQAMAGPRGAMGFSLSNPGMSFANLGEMVGANPAVGLRRSNKYGWVETVDASGAVKGIHFDNPLGGGIFGSLSRAMSGRFGDGISDAERASYEGKAGLW